MRIENEIWILTYKIKLASKKWITHSELFKSSNSMFDKDSKMKTIFGIKNYVIIHQGVSLIQD